MGGFHFYDHGQPLHPLHPDEVLDLVRAGALVPPTADELNDRSKSDGLSKSVAVVQTLWFVTQCIARRIAHLPITSLEVMTLAYTVITLAMYTAWWLKPRNVSCPVRVPGTAVQSVNTTSDSFYWRFLFYVVGMQDSFVKLSQLRGVPTFWTSRDKHDGVLIGEVIPLLRAMCSGRMHRIVTADVVALLVAMVFGAIHCIAWSSAFPSYTEQLMWRMSAIAIVVIPVTMTLSLIIASVTRKMSKLLSDIILIAIFVPCAVVYIAARLMLLVLAFSALRSLPGGAYQTVRWTNFIPHI